MLLFYHNYVQLSSGDASVDGSDSKSQSVEVTGSQHVLVCALHELGCLVLSLGTSASPLVAEPATGESRVVCVNTYWLLALYLLASSLKKCYLPQIECQHNIFS